MGPHTIVCSLAEMCYLLCFKDFPPIALSTFDK